MKHYKPSKSLVSISLLALLAGCGGGSGSSDSASQGTQAALSADQTAFEQFTLAPNASYALGWSLPITGAPAIGTHYIFEEHASMALSPSTGGTQKVIESAPNPIAHTLSIPTGLSAARYMVNGAIVVASVTSKVSYQGTGIRVDQIGVDGSTVVDSQLRTNLSVVPLSGIVSAAPTEFAQWCSVLYYNTALLNTSATWGSGAAYLKFTVTQISDTYAVFDSTGSTTTSTPNPVAAGTTIAALMAAGGINSTADGTTYTLSNGSVSTINGVTTYVASNIRPALTMPSYRTYYELNGNVYTGSLVKAGTTLGGNPYPVAAPGTSAGYTVNYSLQYQIHLNAAAINSLRAALAF